MKPELHVVLGASGAVGSFVVEELLQQGKLVRAVTRKSHLDGKEHEHAELFYHDDALRVINGATHVYLCVGLKYELTAWQTLWPTIIENVIAGCQKNNAVLIFLDNIYMYGPAPLPVPFDELTSQDPPSQKGLVRKQLADRLLEVHKQQKVKVVIGRSADFYGPKATNSLLYISLLEHMIQGKKPSSLGPVNLKHTFAHVHDNARALIALANDPSTYGQVWHLPVSEPITIEQVVQQFNDMLDTNYTIKPMPSWLMSILSLFIPTLKELKEMMYQFTNPYVMNSKKFLDKFPSFHPTSITDGLRQMVEWAKQ